MDESSQNVVAFLDGVCSVWKELNAVWNHYTRLGLKVSSYPSCGPIWGITGGFDLGIMVAGSDGNNYELSTSLSWSDGQWVVRGDASLEQENDRGDWIYPVLRELPEHRAADWPSAIRHWQAAVVGLASFADLIPSRKVD